MFRRRFLSLTLALALIATLFTQLTFEEEAHAGWLEAWAQVHGGYLSGTSDRFDEGSQPFFGFAAGATLLIVDLFIDVRMDKFDTDQAGMWNQVGIGTSFGLPLPAVDVWFGLRAAYLYAQYNEDARAAYNDKLATGERESEPSQKGLNFSGVVGVDVEIVGPLYLSFLGNLGYHVLLPDPTEFHGVNYSGLAGLKLKIGI